MSGRLLLDALGDGQTPLHVHHPVEIDSDHSDVERIQQRFELELRVADEDRREIHDLDAVSPVAQKALQRLEAHREVLVERRDRHVAAGAEEREVDVAPIPELEDRRRMQEQQIGGKGRQGHRSAPGVESQAARFLARTSFAMVAIVSRCSASRSWASNVTP